MADKSNVKIISEGAAETTRVLVDGLEVKGVCSVVIAPIVPRGDVKVVLEVVGAELDIAGELAEVCGNE